MVSNRVELLRRIVYFFFALSAPVLAVLLFLPSTSNPSTERELLRRALAHVLRSGRHQHQHRVLGGVIP